MPGARATSAGRSARRRLRGRHSESRVAYVARNCFCCASACATVPRIAPPVKIGPVRVPAKLQTRARPGEQVTELGARAYQTGRSAKSSGNRGRGPRRCVRLPRSDSVRPDGCRDGAPAESEGRPAGTPGRVSSSTGRPRGIGPGLRPIRTASAFSDCAIARSVAGTTAAAASNSETTCATSTCETTPPLKRRSKSVTASSRVFTVRREISSCLSRSRSVM